MEKGVGQRERKIEGADTGKRGYDKEKDRKSERTLEKRV